MSSSHDVSGHGHGGHETQDFSFKNMLWVIPASIVILIIYTLVCLFGYKGASSSELIEKHSIVLNEQVKALHASEAEILHNYKWINKSADSVQVPIEKAMDLVVKDYGTQK